MTPQQILDRAEEVKNQIGYEDYNLGNIPYIKEPQQAVLMDDDSIINSRPGFLESRYGFIPLIYKVPTGHTLITKGALEELKSYRSFMYMSKNRYNRYKKFMQTEGEVK